MQLKWNAKECIRSLTACGKVESEYTAALNGEIDISVHWIKQFRFSTLSIWSAGAEFSRRGRQLGVAYGDVMVVDRSRQPPNVYAIYEFLKGIDKLDSTAATLRSLVCSGHLAEGFDLGGLIALYSWECWNSVRILDRAAFLTGMADVLHKHFPRAAKAVLLLEPMHFSSVNMVASPAKYQRMYRAKLEKLLAFESTLQLGKRMSPIDQPRDIFLTLVSVQQLDLLMAKLGET